MKKTIITTVATIFVLTLTITSAYAGSGKKHRERLEGFIIGSSAGFLGAIIFNQVHHSRLKVIVSKPRHNRNHQKKHYRNRGHRNNYKYSSHRRGYKGQRGHRGYSRQ